MTTALQAAYAEHLAQKTASIRTLVDGWLPGSAFEGLIACPIESGYRMRAKFSLEWPTAAPAVFGRDPRRGRVPFREAAWILPGAGREIVEVVVLTLAEQAATSVTGFEIRMELSGERGHLELAVPRGTRNFDRSLLAALEARTDRLVGVSVPALQLDRGATSLRHDPDGRHLEADYRAFFQSNLRLLPALLDRVLSSVSEPDHLVDLYCGVGLYSLLAAMPSSRVTGIDRNPRALASAARNAGVRGIAGARFLHGTVEDQIASFDPGRPTHVFLNPSRFGLGEGVPAVVTAWRPAAITLVSCSIESHVKDLARFVESGYRPESIWSFDMFPFTDFVETVTTLREKPE